MITAALRRRALHFQTAPFRGPWPPRRCDVPAPARPGRSHHTSRPARSAEAKPAEAKPAKPAESKPAEGKAAESDGISQEIAYTTVWGQIASFPKRRPYATNIMVATVKTSLADMLVQGMEGKDQIDYSRNAVFTAFGCFYLGAVQWFVYVTLFSRACPNAIRFANMPWAEKLKFRAGQIDLVKQTVLDNFVHYTFLYFPVFYTFKEFIQGKRADGQTRSPLEIFQSAIGKYKKNFMADNMAIWALWIPMDLIIYAIPIWMRLPVNHLVSLAWTMILSKMRGSE